VDIAARRDSGKDYYAAFPTQEATNLGGIVELFDLQVQTVPLWQR